MDQLATSNPRVLIVTPEVTYLPDRMGSLAAVGVLVLLTDHGGVERGKETRVVGVISAVHDRVEQARARGRRAVREVCVVAKIQSNGIRPVLKAIAAENDLRRGHDSSVAEQEEPVRIRGHAVEIECVVRRVNASVEENEDEATEIRIAGATVVQLDEFEAVRAGCVGVGFIDGDFDAGECHTE